MLRKAIILSKVLTSTAFAAGNFQYAHFQRLNTPNNPGEEINSYAEFNLADEWDLKKYRANTKASASIRYYPEGKLTMFSLGEFFIEKNRGNTRVRIGRQILDWTDGEKFWGVGAFNGFKGFNLIDSDQEGLTGLEIQRKMWGGTFKAFGSIVHIPTLNPGYLFRNGDIIGHNEWSKLPPKTLNFREGEAPVRYDLMTPDLNELLLRPSYGVSLQKQLAKLNLSFYGMIKPENKLRTGAYGYYEQEEVDQARMKIRAYSINHSIGGGTLSFPILDVDVKLGAMVIKPDINYHDDFVPESYENYQYETDLYNERHIFASIFLNAEEGDFHLHYISSKRELAMSARRNSGGTNVFGGELRFENALGMDYTRHISDRWFVKARYIGDLNLGDRIFKGELSYTHKSGAKITGGMQMLEIPEDTSYWATFRSNDTLYGNFSYNF